MNDDVINLGQVFSTLRKHLTLIIIMTGLGGLLAAGVTYFVMTPEYQSSSLILVNQKHSTDQNAQYTQLQTDLQQINTYKDIITQSVVMDQVVKDLRKSGFAVDDDLARAITISNNTSSQVMTVTAKADDPYMARAIVNGVVNVFKTKITEIMSNAKNVSVVSKGSLEKGQVSPRPILNLAIGVVLGMIVGIMIAFIRELTDKTVRDTEFIEQTLGLPLLGSISEIDMNNMKLGFSHASQATLRKSRTGRKGQR